MATDWNSAVAKAQFSEVLREAEGGEIVYISRYGKPIAAVVGVEDAKLIERLRASTPKPGLAGLVGRYDDGDAMAQALERVATERRSWEPRPIPFAEWDSRYDLDLDLEGGELMFHDNSE